MQRKLAESPHCLTQKSQLKTQISPRRVGNKSHTVHNQDKLKVFIKFKPNSRQYDDTEQIKYLNDKQIEIKTTLKNKIYSFDHVFDGQKSNLEVFNQGCRDIIEHVFRETQEKNHANHGLIFVYGNTGTGKTYTMGLLNLMHPQSEGIVPNSIRHVFQTKKRKCYERYQISVSFCEIYMDEIFDLLGFQTQTKLVIHEDSKTKQPYVENETIIGVNTLQQAYQIINIGLQKRRVAEQRMNRNSSRGHGIITINLNPNNGDKPGRLCFIDLAGCQRLKDSESKGLTLNEALHINSSLSSLQTLLMNISDQNVRNYRSSKLTRLLQPYIEYGKINLFVTSTSESLNAIEFAKRCKGIKFMQKQLRVCATPIKKQPKTEKDKEKTSKNTKQMEELLQFRKESIEREKKLISCIVSLIGMINKITNQVENNFKKQTLHHRYSFSQIISNLQMQNSINSKIRQFQKKQQVLIEFNLDKLKTGGKFQINSEEILRLLENPAQLTKQISDHANQMLSSLKSLGVYAQYKDIYKQQFFTSELKLHLLENKCKTYEDGLIYLVKYINVNDKRAVKKLKEMGVPTGRENIENIPHLRNRKSLGKSNRKNRSIIKQPHVQEQQQQADAPAAFNPSERRSAIYIEQI